MLPFPCTTWCSMYEQLASLNWPSTLAFALRYLICGKILFILTVSKHTELRTHVLPISVSGRGSYIPLEASTPVTNTYAIHVCDLPHIASKPTFCSVGNREERVAPCFHYTIRVHGSILVLFNAFMMCLIY